MRGTSILTGSNTTPGEKLTEKEKELFTEVLKKCTDYGLDYYPTVIQKLNYDEMSEVAAYGGFPKRYLHWSHGMEYERLSKGYTYGMHRIYEMIINNNPCYMYIMASNTLLDNVTVVAHATGHNDFFKNNVHFSQTDTNAMNKLANNATRIQRYMDRWGVDRVVEFIDHVQRIETLINPAKAWQERTIKSLNIKDKREYYQPRVIEPSKDKSYMYDWLNPKGFREKEAQRIKKLEAINELEILNLDEKDVFGFIKDHAPLKAWQQDVLSMLYEEAMYFAPQGLTKTTNEGFASFIDYEIMTRQGLVGLGQESHDCGIVEYAKHKAGVLGGKYSMNPYKVGFYLLLDIEDRWNKGKFGTEWEECNDMAKKANWDLKLNLGKEKIFEVRKHYDDVVFINEFLTQDFCDKWEFFEWKRYPNGEMKIESRDYKKIKSKLLQRHVNGGLPDIRLVDDNHQGKGHLLLQHYWEGRVLYKKYVESVMCSLHYLWGREIVLATRDQDGDEMVYVCGGVNPEKDVISLSREEYDSAS